MKPAHPSFIFLIALALGSLSISGYAQSAYVAYGKRYYQLIDRYEILSGRLENNFHSSFHPYQRIDIADFAHRRLNDSSLLSQQDRFNLNYLLTDNWEFADSTYGKSRKPFLKNFYTQKNSLWNHHDKEFDIQVLPVIYWTAGKETVNGSVNPDMVITNTRGAEIRGNIGKSIGFYTMLTDNQAMFPTYAMDWVQYYNAVPGEAFYKILPGSSTKLYKNFFKGNGVDFFTARGAVSFNLYKKYINVQLGQDRLFLGNGYRSLLLSDFSSPYPFARFTAKVWKLNYTLLYAQMMYNTSSIPNSRFPKKNLAIHHLSMNLNKHLNIGFFEAVMSPMGLDAAYFNPVIFYKAIVNQTGASDKAMIGFDAKYNFAHHFSAYSQIVINEFVLREVTGGRGWWGNKQAVQLGLKYMNAFNIHNLDLQAEANIIRPYVYSAQDSSASAYTNTNMSLGHPLGGNLKEYIFIARYQPLNRLTLIGKAFFITQGLDPLGKDYGSNPLRPYTARVNEYGNYIGQGDLSHTHFYDFTASYMLKHNLFIDFKQTFRNQTSALGLYNLSNNITSISIRLNMQPRLQEF
ncbi:MAG: hypothetical protein JST43_03105 [Bacteroidetes bacterium]|nr:hypothetical protein [Bacteroidota bacterium]MBS1540286.1 hypothetical protein [Bacteroidota bacterium]